MKLFFLYLFFILSLGSWIQEKNTGQKSNFLDTQSQPVSWNTTKYFSLINEIILSNTNIIISETGRGFCYASSITLLDKTLGNTITSKEYKCETTLSNIVSYGDEFYVAVSDYYFSYLLHNNKEIYMLNNSNIFQILLLNKTTILLNTQIDDGASNVLMLFDVKLGQAIWQQTDIIIGKAVLYNSENVYALSNDCQSIVNLTLSNNDITISVINITYRLPFESHLLISPQNDKIYVTVKEDTNNYFTIYAFEENRNGHIWISDLISMPFSDPIIDNTGEFIFVMDVFKNVLIIIDTTTGKITKKLSESPYYYLIGINHNNILFANEGNYVDLISTEGVILKTLNGDFSGSCLLDKSSIYCCNGLKCSKSLY